MSDSHIGFGAVEEELNLASGLTLPVDSLQRLDTMNLTNITLENNRARYGNLYIAVNMYYVTRAALNTVDVSILISNITSIQRLPTVHGHHDMLGIMVKFDIDFEQIAFLSYWQRLDLDTLLSTVLQNIYVVGGCVQYSGVQSLGRKMFKVKVNNIVVTKVSVLQL